MLSFWRPKRIYLDHAAATPVRPEVLSAMRPYFSEQFGNPGAIHAEGQQAARAVSSARLAVARALGVRPDGVTWTGSGTEANNLAIYGLVRHITEVEGRPFEDLEIITTAIEHPSILKVCDHLAMHGVKIIHAPLLPGGQIDLGQLPSLLSPKTILVSFAYVNSEIGTIMPVRSITRLVRQFNKEHGVSIRVHLDAAQAPLWLPCKPEQLGADLISLDAGKCGGPKGVGLLARLHGVPLKGLILGGGQETDLRSGTENVPLIVGAAHAFVMAQESFLTRAEATTRVRDYAIAQLCSIDGVVLNGDQSDRVANNVNISMSGVEAEFAVVTLDLHGIAAATKSACGSGKGVGSTVIRTLTGDDERARTSLRLTLGEATTTREIDQVVKVLTDHITKTRAFLKQT